MQFVPDLPSDQPPNIKAIMDSVLADMTEPTLAIILPVANDIWTALATIMICYWGLQIAMGKPFDAGDLIEKLFIVGLPHTMLQYYDTPLPWTVSTFPQMIMAGGNWLQGLFAAHAFTDILDQFMLALSRNYASLKADWQAMNVWSLLGSGFHLLITSWLGSSMTMLTLLMVAAVWVLTTAQVLLATLVLAIYVVLGPIFIPFFMMPPLAFLFSGWFRGMLEYSLYGAIAGAMMAVFSAIGSAFLKALSATTFSITDLFLWTILSLLLFVVGLFAALKVGDIASGLVAGAGANASGMVVGAAATIATGGKSVLMKATGGQGALKGAAKAAAPGPSLY